MKTRIFLFRTNRRRRTIFGQSGLLLSREEKKMRNRIRIYLVLSIVVTGLTPTIASAASGSIVGWGWNYDGQANPPAGNDFVAISAGCYHSLALKSDGSIVGWGRNEEGQARPPAGNDFVAISAGGLHSLALKSDASIVQWGNTSFGEGSPPGGNDFMAISAGSHYSLALKSDGSIVGWGRNWHWDGYWCGQADPPAGNDFVAIAAGGWHGLALKSDGSIVAWGSNRDPWTGGWSGQASPPAGNDFVAIAAGSYHSLALKSDGSIVGWGWFSWGAASPPGGNNFVTIARGANYHGLALKTDGSIVGWGAGGPGQSGGPHYGQASPPEGNNVVAIAGGSYHSLALCKVPVEIDLDIKPGSCPNPLNVKSKGVLPVAVLGTADFDVTTIDLASVRLAGVAPIRSSFEDVATPADGDDCDCTTAGPDGYIDLSLKFNAQDIVNAIGEVADGEALELSLTGELLDGTAFEGGDCVVIIAK